MDLTVAEQFYLLKKKKKKGRTPFLLKIVSWVVFGNFKQFGSPWNFNEISWIFNNKVSQSFHILEHFFKFTEILEISWNIILDTILKFHICQKCYEISLNIENLIKFHKVPIEISLKLSIEVFEHYTWGPGPIWGPWGPKLCYYDLDTYSFLIVRIDAFWSIVKIK